jgi:hypothetical protein
MEATLSDSDSEEDLEMAVADDELVRLPGSLLEKAMEFQNDPELPENLYDIPEPAEKPGQEQPGEAEKLKVDQEAKGKGERWGPTLVEKRTSRHQLDGKTVMEKAQERKKKVNLEGSKGNTKSYNPFSVLSNSDISALAEVTGVRLGKNEKDKFAVMFDIQEKEDMMVQSFNASCSVCHSEGRENEDLVVSVVAGEEGEGALETPPVHVNNPQLVGSGMIQGQWTGVINRKKSKPRLNHEMSLLEH